MKNWLVIVIGSILGICAILIFVYFGLIVYLNWPTDRVLAKNLAVTSEWTELSIEPAIKPAYRDQYITLRIKNFKSDLDANSLNGPLKLSDQNVVSPEIELYDASGNKYEFHHSGSVMKFYDEPVFRAGSAGKSFDLPTGREYTRLRIRSDAPFNCDRIAWQDYNPK